MGKLDFGQIRELANAGQTLQKMSETGTQIASAPAQNSGDGWARFERIINGVSDLLDKASQFKNAQGAPANNDKPLYQSPPQYRASMPPVKVAQPAQQNNEKGTPNVMNELFTFLANHINECVKENPNMTLGEAINKLPINVTQASVLLQLFAKKQGG